MNDKHDCKPHVKHMIKLMMEYVINCMIGNKDKTQAETHIMIKCKEAVNMPKLPDVLASIC